MFTVDGTTPVSPKEVINITTSPMSKELSKAHGIQTFSTKTLENIEKLTPQVFSEVRGTEKTMCANVDLYSGLFSIQQQNPSNKVFDIR